MFIDDPRRKPINVSPISLARSTASDDGADTAARAGTPAITAFCTSSKEARPLTTRVAPVRGRRPALSAHPTTLSTAL